MATGTANLDFGAFPGGSDASVAVAAAGVVADSLVEAWLRPEATADHTADEHLVEELKVVAGNIQAGVGFTIYGIHTPAVNPPDIVLGLQSGTNTLILQSQAGTRIYGVWKVAFAWT